MGAVLRIGAFGRPGRPADDCADELSVFTSEFSATPAVRGHRLLKTENVHLKTSLQAISPSPCSSLRRSTLFLGKCRTRKSIWSARMRRPWRQSFGQSFGVLFCAFLELTQETRPDPRSSQVSSKSSLTPNLLGGKPDRRNLRAGSSGAAIICRSCAERAVRETFKAAGEAPGIGPYPAASELSGRSRRSPPRSSGSARGAPASAGRREAFGTTVASGGGGCSRSSPGCACPATRTRGAVPDRPGTLTKVPSTPNSVRFRPVGANRAAPLAPFLPAWASPARAPPGRARMERGLKSVSCVSVMQAGARCRPACARHAGRRRPPFRPQAGEILAGQVIQAPIDHRRVFDAARFGLTTNRYGHTIFICRHQP